MLKVSNALSMRNKLKRLEGNLAGSDSKLFSIAIRPKKILQVVIPETFGVKREVLYEPFSLGCKAISG